MCVASDGVDMVDAAVWVCILWCFMIHFEK